MSTDNIEPLTLGELESFAKRFVSGELGYLCAGCGKCCYAHPIGLTDRDIRRLAQYTHIDYERFKRKYTRRLLHPWEEYVYRFKKHNPCAFLNTTTKRCRVYIARPDVCRTYPFNEIEKDGSINIPSRCSVFPNYYKMRGYKW